MRAVLNDGRLASWAPWLTLVAAFVLRAATLARKSLWLDEVVTLQIAGRSVSDIVALRWDPHPPLYYLFMHYWLRLGQSEVILRLPSAIFAALSVLLLYAFVRQWGSRWTALAAAVLLAVAPMHVWYAQEARMYALVCLWGTASALAFSRAMRTGRLLAWGAWVIVTVLGLYTHYSMLLVVLAEAILWLPLARGGRAQSNRPWLFAPGLALAALLYAPQAAVFVRQLLVGGAASSYYITFQTLLSAYGLRAATAQLHAITLAGGVVLVVLVAALTWFLFDRIKLERAGAGLLAGLAFLYGAVLLVWAEPRGLGLKRQLLLLLPFFLALLAAVIARYPQRLHIVLVLVLLTLPLTGYDALVHQQQDWRGAARFLEAQATAEDMILLNPPWMKDVLEYYYRGPAPRQGVNSQSAPTRLAQLAPAAARTWLVLSSEQYTDPQGRVEAWLRQQRRFQQEYIFPGIRVQVYAP